MQNSMEQDTRAFVDAIKTGFLEVQKDLQRFKRQKVIVLGAGKTIICNAHAAEKKQDDEVLILEASEAHPINAVCDDQIGRSIDANSEDLILRIIVADPKAGHVLIRALQRVSIDPDRVLRVAEKLFQQEYPEYFNKVDWRILPWAENYIKKARALLDVADGE